MGSRGPAPSPTRLKLLKGETRPSRIGHGEPVPRAAEPVPPGWLSPPARDVWDRTVTELDAMGLAHAADADALTVYCCAVVNYARAQQLLDRSEPLLRGSDGGVVRNPAQQMANACAVIIGRFAREFGLTPSARVNLARPGPDYESSRHLAERLLS